MSVFNILGMILDDMTNTASRFMCFSNETETGIEIESYKNDVEFEKVARSTVDDDEAHDFIISITPDENCNFNSEILFINGSGQQERQPLHKQLTERNLLCLYHTMCEEIVNA